MKAIKQNKLLASILTSDILYFTSKGVKNKNVPFFSNKVETKDKTQYVLLNVILLLQSIKQLIRLVQYNLKHYKNFLQIITSSNLYNQIIEYVSKIYGVNDFKINARSNLNAKLNSKMALYIGNDITQDINSVMRKTFANNINSILLINSHFNKNILGNYKLFTDINNYKKLLFIIMLILLSQKTVDPKSVGNFYKKK
jgi:hypothetical protein